MTTDGFTGKVLLDMAISLDGYVGGPDGEAGGLYDWYFQPPTGPDDPNPRVVADLVRTTGAIILGRRTYGTGEDSGAVEDEPYQVPHFVLTHHVPTLSRADPRMNFVTDGIESALRQAKAAAGDRHAVVAGGAQVARQYLRLGLLDEIHLHLVPVLLGGGLRLFEPMETAPVTLESLGLIEAPGVTHVRYRIVK